LRKATIWKNKKEIFSVQVLFMAFGSFFFVFKQSEVDHKGREVEKILW